MSPLFRTLSVFAAIFSISGMAYYYHSIPLRPASLAAQVIEGAPEDDVPTEENATEAASTNTPPLWQSVYPEYKRGADIWGNKVPPTWGWPNPSYAATGLPLYHSIYSYFDAFPTDNPEQNVIIQDTTFPNERYTDNHLQIRTGSIMASPGQDITLEWACQPRQSLSVTCPPYLCRGEYLYYFPEGKNFSTGSQCKAATWDQCPALGRTSVKMGTKDTTYTLTCRSIVREAGGGYLWYAERWTWGGWAWAGGFGTAPTDAVMNITVKVCPAAPAVGTGAYKLQANSKQSINVRVGGKTYSYCVDNPTDNSYLVPAGSSEEMDAFVAAFRSLGLTIE